MLRRTKSIGCNHRRCCALEDLMPVEHPDSDEAPHLTAQQARGGDIVLRTRARRAVFVAGLVLIVILAAIGYWIA